MRAVNPYLNFQGRTREAFEYYESAFGRKVLAMVKFRDFGDGMGVADTDLDKIAHAALPLTDGSILMGTDVVECEGRPPFAEGNNVHICLEVESGREAERLFESLSSGGAVEMELAPTPWAEKYGCCTDRFGVKWMVNFTGGVTFQPGA